MGWPSGGGLAGLFQARPCIFQQVTELVCVNNATAVDQINPGRKGASDRAARGGVPDATLFTSPVRCAIKLAGRQLRVRRRGGERAAEEPLRGRKDICLPTSSKP